MIESKIKELGFNLPEPAKPLAAYVPAVMVDKFVYTAGQLPIVNGELKFTGKVGKDISEDTAQKASEICLMNCLAAVKGAAGTLDNIEKIVKLTAFVASTEGFNGQPKVANGASELVVKIFGEAGKHARSAVGVSELPLNAPVEIEMIVKLK